jgi:hypothetical protein
MAGQHAKGQPVRPNPLQERSSVCIAIIAFCNVKGAPYPSGRVIPSARHPSVTPLFFRVQGGGRMVLTLCSLRVSATTPSLLDAPT